MDSTELYLVYINPLNTDYRNRFVYEFIFSTTTDIEVGEEWSTSGPVNTATPPDPKYANYVGVFRAPEEHELSLLLDNEHFTMYDGVEGVVALGWESEVDFEFDRDRLVFKYGDTLDSVQKQLRTVDLGFYFSKEYMAK